MQNFARAHIEATDNEYLSVSCPDENILVKANQKMADEAKKQTNDVLDSILRVSSADMKNNYHRTDN